MLVVQQYHWVFNNIATVNFVNICICNNNIKEFEKSGIFLIVIQFSLRKSRTSSFLFVISGTFADVSVSR